MSVLITSVASGTGPTKAREIEIAGILVVGVASIVVGASGCGKGGEAWGAVATDSAGIRIVEVGPGFPGFVKTRVVADEPDVVIGFREDDPGTIVSKVTDVAWLGGSRLAVADEGGDEIFVFDSAGHHVGTWGGRGGGPGEFGRLAWLRAKPPDSVAAGDARLRRVTVFDGGGGFARSIGTGRAVGESSGSIPPQPLGLLEDGSVVAAFFESVTTRVEGTVRPQVEVVVIAPTEGNENLLGIWPGDELALFWEDGVLQVVAPPFGRRLHISAGPDAVWIGDDAEWEIRGYAADALLRTVVRFSANRKSVSGRLLEQRIAEKYRGRVFEESFFEKLKDDQLKIAYHSTTPGFGTMIGVIGGGVAVSEYQLGAAGSRKWFVVDSIGEVTRVEIPATLDVKRWGPDWVIGVVRDELGRETIHRYSILDSIQSPVT